MLHTSSYRFNKNFQCTNVFYSLNIHISFSSTIYSIFIWCAPWIHNMCAVTKLWKFCFCFYRFAGVNCCLYIKIYIIVKIANGYRVEISDKTYALYSIHFGIIAAKFNKYNYVESNSNLFDMLQTQGYQFHSEIIINLFLIH